MKTSLDRRANGGRAEVFEGLLIQGDRPFPYPYINFYVFSLDAKMRGG
jgi:hypothetical protein